MSKYRVLIFDLDDTLIDNTENVRCAYKKILQIMGEEYSEAKFNRWRAIDKKFWCDRQDGLIEIPGEFRHENGKKSQKFLDWLRAQRFLIYFDNQITLAEAIRLNDLFVEALTEKVVVIPGAREILRYLKPKYQIIVATNGPGVVAKDKLAKIGCLTDVDMILSADMFGYMKPKQEFFEAIQKLLNNYRTEEYLMIGDSLKSDVGFAMNCGFDSCWLKRGDDELGDYQPTLVIRELSDLKVIL